MLLLCRFAGIILFLLGKGNPRVGENHPDVSILASWNAGKHWSEIVPRGAHVPAIQNTCQSPAITQHE